MPSMARISWVYPMLAALMVGHHAVPAQADEEASRRVAGKIWRVTRNCGINCLYLYLKLNGIQADYDDLLRTIPIEARGTRLVDLRKAAAARGAEVALMQSTPDELSKLPMPLIAHMERPEGEGGHFVLILAVHATNVEVIDGSTAVRQWIKVDEFRRRWSGYLLGPRTDSNARGIALASMIGFGCVLGYVAVSHPWRARACGA
jgi:hypothetical protein